jgi:hypothetical protein
MNFNGLLMDKWITLIHPLTIQSKSIQSIHFDTPMCNEHWQSATCMVLQLQVKSKYKDWEILLDTLSISIHVMTKINNPQKTKTMCPFLFSPPTPMS